MQEGIGGETSKVQAQIDTAKKNKIKSEAKLKQRVQEMIKYTDVYRCGMEVEFQRCQEEEHGKPAQRGEGREGEKKALAEVCGGRMAESAEVSRVQQSSRKLSRDSRGQQGSACVARGNTT